jgi:DNA (cytosine-5)-methyltransferase 1
VVNRVFWSSHFSGAGGSTLGAIAAAKAAKIKLNIISAIDYDADIARLYADNISEELIVKSVVDIDWRSLKIPLPYEGRILIHQTSPPCQDDSLLKNLSRNFEQSRGEFLLQTFDFYRVYLPEIVILENVPQYRKNTAYLLFLDLLKSLGYQIKEAVLNASNYGVPQDRKRLITIADRTGLNFAPELKNPIGWLAAASPYLDSCQPGELSKAQAKVLEQQVKPQDLIIERIGYFGKPKFRLGHQPVWTLRAGIANDGKGHTRTKIMNICLEDGRCLNVNEKVLGALQGFPQEYRYSCDFGVNVRAIGNSVPAPMMQCIVQPMLRALSGGDR